MKVVTAENNFCYLVPRKYPNENDVLILELQKIGNIVFDWQIEKQNLKLEINDTSIFTQGENYPFTLKIGSEIIYKGVLLFLKNGTDVQNFSNNSQDKKRFY